MNQSYQPLRGYRVLDLTNVLSGPMCCQQLAMLGADVIKIERPDGGDLSRRLGADEALSESNMGASYLGQNAGKRSIAVNLKHDAGKDIIRRLAARSDVLVENFRPGVMDRLGLGYKRLQEINSSIVYCAISGFGQSGPLSQLPAYDQIVQGMAGVMAITGDKESAPKRVGYPIADTIGGLTAALAITASLAGRARDKDARGCMIDVSMLESTLATMGWVISNWLMAGMRPAPLGNTNFTASPSGTFQTADGLLNIAANRQTQFEALCRELGCPALVDEDRFADRFQRLANRDQLNQLLEERLSTDTAENWQRRLTAASIPAGRILTVPETINSAQLRERKLVHSFGALSRSVVAGPGFLIDGIRPTTDVPPPSLGADTDDILAEAGINDQDIEKLRALGTIL